MLAVRKRHRRRMKKRWPCSKPFHILGQAAHASSPLRFLQFLRKHFWMRLMPGGFCAPW